MQSARIAASPDDRATAASASPEATGSKKSLLERSLEAAQSEEVAWEQPVEEDARAEARRTMFKEGRAPFCATTTNDLRSMGPGPAIYFRTEKTLACFFSLMTVVLIPTFLITSSGTRVSSEDKDGLHFNELSLANVGFPKDESDTNSTFSNRILDVPILGSLSEIDMATWIMAVDLINSFLFLLLIFTIRRIANDEHRHFSNEAVTASSFTVMVRDLPRDATEGEILAHFDNLYNLSKDDWVYEGKSCGCGAKSTQRAKYHVASPVEETTDPGGAASGTRAGASLKNLPGSSASLLPHGGQKIANPVVDTFHNGEPQYRGKWVADVSVAHPNGALIRKYQKIKTLRTQLRLAIARAQKLRSEGKVQKIEKGVQEVEKLAKELEEINSEALTDFSHECVAAFVTFNNVESKRRCLEDAATQKHWLLGYPPTLKFRGTHALRVEEAPDPTDIIWENLEVTDRQRAIRATAASIFVFILLILSTVAVFATQQTKSEFVNQVPDVSVCALELPAARYGGYDRVPPTFSIVHVKDRDSECGVPETFFLELVPAPGAVDWNATTMDLTNIPPISFQRCNGTCFSSADAYPCPTFQRGKTYTGSTMVGCFCIQELKDAIREDGIVDGPQRVVDETGDVCISFVTDYLAGQSLVIGAAIIVVVINITLRFVLEAMTDFERFATSSERNRALATKIFVSQLINTGVIVLIVNAQIEALNELRVFGLFNGPFPSFLPRWFSSVGIGIAITMASNIVVPNIDPVTRFLCLQPWARRSAVRNSIDQKSLNEGIKPPPFSFSSRYPLFLNTIFVTLMYSGGIPLLIPFAAVFFVVSYNIDKCTVLRLYSLPPREDQAFRMLTRALPWSLVIHLAFTVYMYSDNATLKSEPLILANVGGVSTSDAVDAATSSVDSSGFAPKLLRTNVFPLFLFLLLLLAALVLVNVAKAAVEHVLGRLLCVLSCGVLCRGSRRVSPAAESLQPAFTGEYFEVVRSGQSTTPSAEAEAQGVRISESATSQGPIYVLTHVWLSHGVSFDRYHDANECKRTYEAIAEHGTASYRIDASPNYAEAVQTMREGLLNAGNEVIPLAPGANSSGDDMLAWLEGSSEAATAPHGSVEHESDGGDFGGGAFLVRVRPADLSATGGLPTDIACLSSPDLLLSSPEPFVSPSDVPPPLVRSGFWAHAAGEEGLDAAELRREELGDLGHPHTVSANGLPVAEPSGEGAPDAFPFEGRFDVERGATRSISSRPDSAHSEGRGREERNGATAASPAGEAAPLAAPAFPDSPPPLVEAASAVELL